MKRGPFSNQGTLICPPFLREVRVPGVLPESRGALEGARRGKMLNASWRRSGEGEGLCHRGRGGY